jgi:hypothetical protein
MPGDVGAAGAGDVALALLLALVSFELARENFPLDAVPAKLSMLRKTPTKQRLRPNKMRGLKRPDWDMSLFFIAGLFLSLSSNFGQRCSAASHAKQFDSFSTRFFAC